MRFTNQPEKRECIKENIDWDALTIKTTFYGLTIKIQKQSPIDVPGKRFSENMQQTYRRTFMPKCDFNRVALQLCNFIETALRHGCSPINLLHIFRTSFTKNTSGWTVCYYHVTYEYVLLLNLLIGFIKISISDQRCIRNLVKYWRWSVCGNRSRFKSR